MKKYFMMMMIFALSISLFAKISLVSKDNNQYIIDFDLGDFSISNSGQFSKISAKDLKRSDRTGFPDLPYEMTKIIIPSNGNISVTLLSKKTKTLILKKRISPIPTIQKVINKNGKISYSEIPIINENFYRKSEKIVQTLPKDRFREFYFQNIKINPFEYFPSKNKIQVYEKIRLLVTINGNVRQNTPINENENFCKSIFLNWESGKNWKSTIKEKDIHYFDFSQSDFWFKFEISSDGIYKITKNDLQSLPLSDIDPRTFRIFSTGGESCIDNYSFTGNKMQEIPIKVEGENDGSFDANDKIIFYAQDRNGNTVNSHLPQQMYVNPYSTKTVYWLTFGGNFDNSPNRIKSEDIDSEPDKIVNSVVRRVHYESENIMEQSGRLKWFSDDLSGTSNSNYHYSINLENFSNHQSYDAGSDSLAYIKFLFRGNTGGSGIYYQAQISMNDFPGVVNTWSGNVDYYIFFNQNDGWNSGQNNLNIKIFRNSAKTIYLDYYDLYYLTDLIKQNKAFSFSVKDTIPHSSTLQNKIVRYNFSGDSQGLSVFKIDNFHQVTLLQTHNSGTNFYFISQNNSNNQYFVVSDSDLKSVSNIASYTPVDITDTSHQYDSIIICSNIFQQQANEMKDLNYQYENSTAKVVNQQSIFDQFNGGNPSPLAIRLYLKYAYDNFPAPVISHLILFGSGTHEWNHNNGINTEKNQIMTYIIESDETDDGFAYLHSYNHPDLGVGRIPVQNETQANNYLDKLRNYFENQQSGFWRNQMVFFADDNFHLKSHLDISHTRQMQEASEIINPAIISDKIFAVDYPFDQYRNKPQARDAMIASVNKGKLIWYYIGHGAYYGLGDEDYFIGNTDMHFLHNKDHLPLFIAAACAVAEFDFLSYDSCADQLIKYTDGGSIVSIASTRGCNGPANTNLMKDYLIKSTKNYEDVGKSLMLAKTLNASSNSRRFIIFGDPVLHVTPPVSNNSLEIENNPDSLQARQLVKISGKLSSSTNGIGSSFVYDSSQPQTYVFMINDTTFSYVNVTHPSQHLFQGKMTVTNGNFVSNFIVPDDIKGGNLGKIVSYVYDENSQKNYSSYLTPLKINGHNLVVENTDAPKIDIWLESYNFHDGDKVSSSPTLLANISDSNGINILGSSGHKIFALIDNSNEVHDLSEYFIYDIDSYTSGKLEWLLPEMSSGNHTLQLIAFDNFNAPSIKKVNFKVDKNDAILITKMYPYPNPMKNKTNFTFNISSEADVTITIYTISGKKIRKLESNGCKKGYNQIFWNGLDEDGNRIANNTYFYKLTARKIGNNKSSHKIDKITIYN